MRVRRALLSGVAALAGLALPAVVTAQVAPKTAAPPPAAAKPPAQGPGFRRTSEFQALSKRAQAAHEAQKLDEALEAYQKALRLRPGWSEGRFALGTVLYDLDRYEEARAEFRQVTVQEPRSGAAWAFKGMCEFQLRRHEEALADLQKGRLLGPREQPRPQVRGRLPRGDPPGALRPVRGGPRDPEQLRPRRPGQPGGHRGAGPCRPAHALPALRGPARQEGDAHHRRACPLPVHQEPLLPHRATRVRRVRHPLPRRSRTPTTRGAPSS